MQKPKIAILSGTEDPIESMPSSIEAKKLMEIARNENFNAFVHGPLALDNAISKEAANIKGIENRVEQVLANLLENSISFSKDNQNIVVKLSQKKDGKISLSVIDEGIGFKEKNTDKIFKRFYSNRPDKFGQHSGLGLNIVKNLVDLHNATIRASNRKDQKGASMEIIFPKA